MMQKELKPIGKSKKGRDLYSTQDVLKNATDFDRTNIYYNSGIYFRLVPFTLKLAYVVPLNSKYAYLKPRKGVILSSKWVCDLSKLEKQPTTLKLEERVAKEKQNEFSNV